MKRELSALARELRRRVENSDEAEWMDSASAAEKPADAKAGRLKELAETVGACRSCPLGSQRLNAAFGVGSAHAQVLFIGEGPGYEEDRRGEPFVGRAGQLLDKIFASIGLSRKSVYIANIVKCHPMKDPAHPDARGNDRPPTPEEIAACRHFLDEQIALISPRVIVTLGSVATRVMLGTEEPITRIRGQWRSYCPANGRPVKLLPTFHPAALLRNPNLKKDVWIDMKNLRAELAAGGCNP